MRKPVYVIYEQQRGRSACTSAFVLHCLDDIIPVLATAIISRLWLASVAEQSSLSLT